MAGETTSAKKYGRLEFWDQCYREDERFSWYCGWADLQPFWAELVPDRDARVLVPGVGNDAAMVDMYDAGWRRLTLFDYAPEGVERAAALFGERRPVDLSVADACALPYTDGAFDACLDKGTLDAVYISGAANLDRAVDELGRTMSPGGVLLSVSAAAAPRVAGAFGRRSDTWRVLRDGSFYMTEDGWASHNVDATLLAWQRL